MSANDVITYLSLQQYQKNLEASWFNIDEGRFFVLAGEAVIKFKGNSIKTSHSSQKSKGSYYNLLLELLNKYPDGCTDIRVRDIFSEKYKEFKIYNALCKNNNGLWGHIGVQNQMPNSKEKIIHISKGKLTFKNIV